MNIALQEAESAADLGEIPVGAVILSAKGEVIAKASNRTRALNDQRMQKCWPFAQPVPALGKNDWMAMIFRDHEALCNAGVIAAARIRRLYYGASDPKSGGVEQGACVFDHPQSHHRPEVYAGVGETDARRLLTDFLRSCVKNSTLFP